jgi:HTH-type transcriptional regulator/antitoxin HigA
MARAVDEQDRAGRQDEYLNLVREWPLRPIRNAGELDRAIRMLDSLSDRPHLSPDAKDYLLVLVDLVGKYEQERFPIPPVSAAEVLEHLVESRGVTQRDVSTATGIAETTVSELLRGKRPMNRRHIEALARFFAVSPAVFFES